MHGDNRLGRVGATAGTSATQDVWVVGAVSVGGGGCSHGGKLEGALGSQHGDFDSRAHRRRHSGRAAGEIPLPPGARQDQQRFETAASQRALKRPAVNGVLLTVGQSALWVESEPHPPCHPCILRRLGLRRGPRHPLPAGIAPSNMVDESDA